MCASMTFQYSSGLVYPTSLFIVWPVLQPLESRSASTGIQIACVNWNPGKQRQKDIFN